MMQPTAAGSSVLGLLALLLWAGTVQAAPCQNNLPASNPGSAYIDHGDGTVTDRRTGLMWKKCAEGFSGAACQTGASEIYSWADALAHAEASTFANHSDWRLPNVKELSSLVEECRRLPAINTILFPNTPSEMFWSSSPGLWVSYIAWFVHFDEGITGLQYGRTSPLRIRLVRDAQ